MFQAPFTCHNFYELLLAVRQATKEKAFEIKYVSIVARFFSDFADITSRDGYNTEFMVSLIHHSHSYLTYGTSESIPICIVLSHAKLHG